LEVLVHRRRAVGVFDPERALLHLLETERHRALGEPALDELLRHEQRRRPRRAVVVHVVDGDARQAELVERALAAGRVAVAVADGGLLDGGERNARVLERLLSGLAAHVRIVPLLRAGLLELGHADADDEYLPTHFGVTPWI